MRTPFLGLLVAAALPVVLASCNAGPSPEKQRAALDAFGVVYAVFQHPRCRNCHIPGDAPLVTDAGEPHPMGVARGPAGHGAPGLPCSSCHGTANPPASYGTNVPPGAPNWALPPPEHRMAWIDLPPPKLCAMIKDREQNGNRDLAAMFEHVDKDKLVLWGWEPGTGRAPVPVPHARFAAAFKTWTDAGGPCPG